MQPPRDLHSGEEKFHHHKQERILEPKDGLSPSDKGNYGGIRT